MVRVVSLDHLVLTVQDIPRAIKFYVEILGMQEVTFGDNRKRLPTDSKKSLCIILARNLSPKLLHPCLAQPISVL